MIIFTPAMKNRFLILLTFLIGLFLVFLPLPYQLHWLNTLWIVLILLYWVLMKPQDVNLGYAWLVGIFIDMIYNVTIGLHALGLVIVVFLMLKICEKIVDISLLKITPVIFGLLVLYQSLLFLMQSYVGNGFSPLSILSGTLLGTVAWPLLSWILFNYQKRFHL